MAVMRGEVCTLANNKVESGFSLRRNFGYIERLLSHLTSALALAVRFSGACINTSGIEQTRLMSGFTITLRDSANSLFF